MVASTASSNPTATSPIGCSRGKATKIPTSTWASSWSSSRSGPATWAISWRIPQQERVLWKADGSLIRGAELVTHPASLRYHLEEFDWNGLLEQVADADLYVAASCGMHIHASKPGNYRQMNRLMTMLIDYEKELCGVSLRHQRDLDRWARWNSHGWEISKQETQSKYETWLQLMRHCRNRGRYIALNVGPPDTVEFRFFAGSEDQRAGAGPPVPSWIT